jgi:hypothetical protein
MPSEENGHWRTARSLRGTEEAPMRFRLGTAFRIGETAVAECMEVD